MPIFRADLHVHTVLSPCADTEMIPPLIIQEAVQNGIDILAITDHNASDNVVAVQRAAKDSGIFILPGIELQTAEEVHVLSIFDELDQLREFQKHIDLALPTLENNVDFFGEQFIVDETGDFIRRDDRLLLTSTNLSLNAAWELTQKLGGILIPAHVNRQAFGIFQVLGFIPDDIPLEIVEISMHVTPDQARLQFPSLKNYSLVQNGDAHFLEDIKGVNRLVIEKPSVTEIRLAVLNQENRQHEIL